MEHKMPFKYYNKHESKTMSSGNAVTLQVPVYGTIHNIALRFTTSAGADCTEAQIRSEVGNVRLTFNGRDIVNCTAARLYDLYEVLGTEVQEYQGIAGVMELNLARLLFNNPSTRDNFAFGTADLQTIQVTVTAGTLTNVSAVQVVTGRTAENRKLGAYGKFIDYPISFNTTGDHTVDTLPRDPDSAYAVVMAYMGASGTITDGELRVNNVTVQEKLPANLNKLFLSNNRLAVPSGYYVYGINDGQDSTLIAMAGVTDLRFIQTFSVAPGAAGYVLSALTINGIVNK